MLMNKNHEKRVTRKHSKKICRRRIIPHEETVDKMEKCH